MAESPASGFRIRSGILRKYTGSDSVVMIPDSVIGIGDMAFYGCRTLKTVIIPASVKEIGTDAFSGCPDFVIRAPYGSFAAEYAIKNRKFTLSS